MATPAAYWIRLKTDIWSNDDRIKLIDAMPDADAILVIWFKLLTQAGKANANGRVQINDFIPLEPDMLVTIFNRPQAQIDRALDVLNRFGLIDTADGIDINDWDEYVNLDVMEKLREENARRVREHRDRKAKEKLARDNEKASNGAVCKHCNITCNGTCNGHKKEEVRIKNIELEKELKDNAQRPAEPDTVTGESIKPEPEVITEPDPIPYKAIIDYLNEVCGTAFKYAEGHKRHIKARWNEGQRLEDFKHVINVKFEEWGVPVRGKDNRVYLRPETLFSPKFDGYRNQRMKNGKGGGDDGGKPSDKGSQSLASFVIE